GQKAFKAGDSVKALIAFNHARGLRPSDPELEKAGWRAHTLFLAQNADRVTLDNLEESSYEVQRLVEDEPRNAIYLAAMAHVLQRRGQTAEASQKMAEAVKL